MLLFLFPLISREIDSGGVIRGCSILDVSEFKRLSLGTSKHICFAVDIREWGGVPIAWVTYF